MPQVEIGEAMNLLIDVLLLPIVAIVLRQKSVPRSGTILAGAFLIVASHVATIIETFVLAEAFDAIEHLALVAAGAVFVVALAHGAKELGTPDARRRP